MAKNETAKKTGMIKKTKAVLGEVSQKTEADIKEIDIDHILKQVMKLPIVKVNREKYLRKELIKFYPEKIVNLAIESNPAYAGIGRDMISQIAKQAIDYETNKVTAISFAAGLPGGAAMAATIPADIAQYFTFVLRIMQKLAYLYGFEEFNLNEDEISDETMNQIMVFLGVMLGVHGANAGVKIIAEYAANRVSKSLAQKALTKGAIYPIVKKIAQTVGIRMTKQIFANGVSKVVPVIGGVVSGGLTFATFKPCAIRLKNSFYGLNLSNPDYYKDGTSSVEPVAEIEECDGVETDMPYEFKNFKDDYTDFCKTIMSKTIHSDNGDNVFVSPLSIYVLMTMISCITEGNTKAEIEELIFAGHTSEETIKYLGELLAELRTDNETKFKEANAIVVKNEWSEYIKSDRTELLKTLFRARIFSDKNCDDVVNKWVSKQTEGMISELIVPSDFADFALANAVTFMGNWQKEYEPGQIKTRGIFTNVHGMNEETVYLSSVENMGIQSKDFIGFTKPYKGGEYDFIALISKDSEYNINQIIENCIYGKIRELYMNARQITVYANIPEFKFLYNLDLTEILKQMGVERLFTTEADLSPVISAPQSHVEKIFHKAYIQVDRNGTKAAVASAAMGLAGGVDGYEEDCMSVNLNHPFVFGIMHKSTELPVFIGMVGSIGGETVKMDEDGLIEWD